MAKGLVIVRQCMKRRLAIREIDVLIIDPACLSIMEAQMYLYWILVLQTKLGTRRHQLLYQYVCLSVCLSVMLALIER